MAQKLKDKPVTRERNDSEGSGIHFLVLFNDNIHTFNFVIESLIEICQHSSVQAEQCAIIAHLKGRCEIKQGTHNDLVPMHAALSEKGLITEID
jgi:ATP-dependent Clp protease adaptor protein ClpS